MLHKIRIVVCGVSSGDINFDIRLLFLLSVCRYLVFEKSWKLMECNKYDNKFVNEYSLLTFTNVHPLPIC